MSWSRADGLLIAVLAVAAFVVARWYLPQYRAAGGAPRFYQDQFAPAVMLACGHGFVNVDVTAAPALDAFLRQQTDRLRCADLTGPLPSLPLNALQATSPYLMGSTAYLWRASGVEWRALDWLTGALFASSIAAAYATIRAACGRLISFGVSAWWMLSPRHIENLPNLRDYSKSPFFVMMLAAIGLALVARRRRHLLALGLLFGALQGVGFGMRTDVAMNFVPFLLVLFAIPSDAVRSVPAKAACAAAALFAFVVIAYPVNRAYSAQSNVWHTALIGFTAPHDGSLNIDFPRPVYSYPYAFNDEYIEAVVRSYSTRVNPDHEPVKMLKRGYNEACRDYFVRLASMFPADVMVRMVAAAVHVANLPFLVGAARAPFGVTGSVATALWDLRARLLELFGSTGPILLAGVLVVAGAEHVRYAAAALLGLGVLLTYPFLQFEARHIFHLESAVLAAIVCGAAVAARRVRAHALADYGRAVLWMTAAFVAVAVILAAVRGIQSTRARQLLTSYRAAAVEPLAVRAAPARDGWTRLDVDVFDAVTTSDDIQEVMVRADFALAACGSPPEVEAVFRYDEHEPVHDVSRQMTVLLGHDTTTPVFMPVYSMTRRSQQLARFIGVEVPANAGSCVRLSRVRAISNTSLWLSAMLMPGWESRLYQRMRWYPAYIR